MCHLPEGGAGATVDEHASNRRGMRVFIILSIYLCYVQQLPLVVSTREYNYYAVPTVSRAKIGRSKPQTNIRR